MSDATTMAEFTRKVDRLIDEAMHARSGQSDLDERFREEVLDAFRAAQQGLEDSERLDWLEAIKRERGRGGWRIDPPSEGWPLQVFTRGPYHSIRAAIDAARASQGKEEGRE